MRQKHDQFTLIHFKYLFKISEIKIDVSSKFDKEYDSSVSRFEF